MTWWIAAFLMFGAGFGLATFSRRHLFSEGSTRYSGVRARDPLDGRLVWVVTCTCLWPIFALTGLYSMWRRSRRS